MDGYFLKQFFKKNTFNLKKDSKPSKEIKQKKIKTHKWPLGHKHFSKSDLYFSKEYSSLTLTSFYMETELNTFNNHLQ